MISTVTTTTVSTVTTVALAGSLGLVTVLVLMALLVQKEVSAAVVVNERSTEKLRQALDIAIAPLMIAFALIAAFKILETLR